MALPKLFEQSVLIRLECFTCQTSINIPEQFITSANAALDIGTGAYDTMS